jgi:hypothetical protein
MRLDSSGDLALGTTTGSIFSTSGINLSVSNSSGLATVAVAGSSGNSGYVELGSGSVRGALIEGSTNYLAFYTNSTGTGTSVSERARIDSSGNLGLGVTPSAWGSTSKALQFSTGAFEARSASFSSNTNAYFNAGWLYVGTGRATLYNQTDGQHVWYNSASGTAGNAITFTQAMTLDASGNLGVGTTTVLGSARATFKAGSALPGISIGMANSSGTYPAQIFFDGDDTDSGSIDVNNDANTTAYTTSSDYRLKVNVQPIANALTKVSQLNPVIWNWKKNPSLNSSGFIAHELQAVCPDAVTGYKDEVDEEGNPKYQGIDTSFLVATLTAAIQEQQALITQLTDRITALERA